MPMIVLDLVNVIESCIRTKYLRNLYAVSLLVVLKKSCHDTWKGKRTTVEGMGELSLAFGVLVSELQTVCLIRLEV